MFLYFNENTKYITINTKLVMYAYAQNIVHDYFIKYVGLGYKLSICSFNGKMQFHVSVDKRNFPYKQRIKFF